MKDRISTTKNLKKKKKILSSTTKNKKKSVEPKKKLGMGLSSLLSKDHELASVIKSKIKNKLATTPLKIEIPKMSKRDDSKLSILSLKMKEQSNQLEQSNQGKIPIQNLRTGKFQPRKIFDQTELEELAESIKSNGVLQPILVRPLTNQGSTFEIIAGERRWRAAQLAKLHEVPVIIRDFNDETAIGVAMIENLQRTDLNLIEEAEGYRTMMNVFEYTQEKLSIQLGKSRSHIANVLRLLSLPKVIRKHIINNDLSFGHARALVTLSEEQATRVVEEVLKKQLNVRSTEKIVNQLKGSDDRSYNYNKIPNHNQNESKDSNIESLERELTNLLGLKVIISHKSNNTGNLAIFYKDLDQIQPVIDKLKWRPK